MNNFVQTKLLNVIFLIALAILFLSNILVYHQIQQLSEANAWVIHTHEVIENSHQALIDILESEQQLHLYLETKNEYGLKAYQTAVKETQQALSDIRTLTIQNENQQQRLDRLEPLLTEYKGLQENILKVFHQSGQPAALKLMLSPQSTILAQEIKKLTEEFIDTEVNLLHTRNTDAIRHSKDSNLMVLYVSLLSDFLLLLSFFLFTHQLNERRQAEIKKLEIQDQLKGIIEGSNDLIAALDNKFQFIAFNSKYEKAFQKNYGKHLTLGTSLSEALADNPSDQTEFMQAWKQALSGHEFSLVREWGTNKFYEISFTTIQNSEGKLIGACHVMRDITQSRQDEISLTKANAKLESGLQQLGQRYHEITLLNDLSEALQSCFTTEETYAPIHTFCPQIFPFAKGMLYIMHPSRSHLELTVQWGENKTSEHIFSPEKCWALRRNQIHNVSNIHQNIICEHVANQSNEDIKPYVCIPLMAHNETLGLLYLEAKTAATTEAGNSFNDEHVSLLFITTAEQISLALANIKLRETLRHLSIRDPLTGLFNRRYLDETLQRELLRAERKKTSLAVIMVDIDHFKRFNDTFGHDAGDLVLKTMGKLFQQEIRGSDMVCRLGGEEFVIVLYDTNLECTKQFSERLRHSVEVLSISYNNQHLSSITISQGIALFPQDGTTPKTLVEAADHALYTAKKSGRNCTIAAADEAIDAP